MMDNGYTASTLCVKIGDGSQIISAYPREDANFGSDMGEKGEGMMDKDKRIEELEKQIVALTAENKRRWDSLDKIAIMADNFDGYEYIRLAAEAGKEGKG